LSYFLLFYFYFINKLFLLGKMVVSRMIARCGRVTQIPLIAMPEPWYIHIKSDGKEGICPKTFDDAKEYLKNFTGMSSLINIFFY
jgi:hypothetical protein